MNNLRQEFEITAPQVTRCQRCLGNLFFSLKYYFLGMNAHNNQHTGDRLLLEFNLASVIGALASDLDTEDCVRSNLNVR